MTIKEQPLLRYRKHKHARVEALRCETYIHQFFNHNDIRAQVIRHGNIL